MQASLRHYRDEAGREKGQLVLQFTAEESHALSAGFPGQQARAVIEGNLARGLRIFFTTRAGAGYNLDHRTNSVRVPHFKVGARDDETLPPTEIPARLERGEDGPELRVDTFPDPFWRRDLRSIADKLFNGAVSVQRKSLKPVPHDHGKEAKALDMEVLRPRPVAKSVQPTASAVAETTTDAPGMRVQYSLDDAREAARLLNEILTSHPDVVVVVEDNRVALRRRVERFEEL